ncbi:MAG: Fic family protein [Cyclobacteriaceae bacterium]|nr:Fic family protein [Cyclobacteriaceae bacterium]
MTLKETLNIIQQLNTELDTLRPISPEQEKVIMDKFRLDWNFNSNHLEGNLLTFGETKALLLHGITAQGKPLKDHLEIKGHNEAIKYIEEVVKKERPLTETFIREIHEMILKEPYKVDSITPDGKPVKRMIQIGQYKTVPNHVKTKTGEIFRFASPEETPAKMAELMEWLRNELQKKNKIPVLIAAEFHYRFILIHPFDDGNGRLARILMNFLLMMMGHPPVIIKTEKKIEYFKALQLADSGNLEFFINYIAKQLIWSLEIMLKGAKGESIEESDDIDKKIELVKSQLAKENISTLKKSAATIYPILLKGIIPLLDKFEEKCETLKELFIEFDRQLFYTSNEGSGQKQVGVKDTKWHIIIANLVEGTVRRDQTLINEVNYTFQLRGFKKNISVHYMQTSLKVDFREFTYLIEVSNNSQGRWEYPYDKALPESDLNKLVNTMIEYILKQISESSGFKP